MLKVIDRDVAGAAPEIAIDHSASRTAGQTISFSAKKTGGNPVVAWKWTFGDGVTADGQEARHTWTEPGDYVVTVTARGLDGEETPQQYRAHITGHMSTTFNPAEIRRLP